MKKKKTSTEIFLVESNGQDVTLFRKCDTHEKAVRKMQADYEETKREWKENGIYSYDELTEFHAKVFGIHGETWFARQILYFNHDKYDC